MQDPRISIMAFDVMKFMGFIIIVPLHSNLTFLIFSRFGTVEVPSFFLKRKKKVRYLFLFVFQTVFTSPLLTGI